MARQRKTKNTYRRRRKKYSFSALWRLFLLGIFVGMVISYLAQSTYSSQAAYKARDLKRKIQALEAQKEALRLKVSQVKSLEKISQKIDELKMVAADQVEYLTPQGSMAKK